MEHVWRNSDRVNVRARGLSPKAARVITHEDVLEIPDEYQLLDPELVELLEARAGGFLNGCRCRKVDNQPNGTNLAEHAEPPQSDPELLDEYDFSKGEVGRYAKRYAEGTNVVVLDPDVAAVFKTAESVNRVLREHLKKTAGHGD